MARGTEARIVDGLRRRCGSRQTVVVVSESGTVQGREEEIVQFLRQKAGSINAGGGLCCRSLLCRLPGPVRNLSTSARAPLCTMHKRHASRLLIPFQKNLVRKRDDNRVLLRTSGRRDVSQSRWSHCSKVISSTGTFDKGGERGENAPSNRPEAEQFQFISNCVNGTSSGAMFLKHTDLRYR